MKKYLFAFICLVSSNCFAELYLEAGAFYLEDQFYTSSPRIINGEIVSEYKYSGNAAAHAAIGYEFNLDSIDIDIELKHQSDPNETGKNDLMDSNALGIVVRKYFR